MWSFVKKVYPSFKVSDYGVMARSLISESEKEEFHEVRGKLARFFSAWVPDKPGIEDFVIFSDWKAGAPMDSLKRDYEAANQLTAMLAWLELALVQWTQQDGSGKTGLFRLATELNVDG